jgi:predicted nucleic acid-binding protein
VIVLDAAALVDVLVDQPSKPWVLDRLEGAAICAPAHQPAEVLSAITRLARAGVLSEAAAKDALVEASRLQQELVPLTESQLRRAYALSGRIRVLDGLYVALAEERAAPLVTSDQRLARAQLPVTVESP